MRPIERQKYQSVIIFQARSQAYARNAARTTLRTSVMRINDVNEDGRTNIASRTMRKVPKTTERQTKTTRPARAIIRTLRHLGKEECQYGQRGR